VIAPPFKQPAQPVIASSNQAHEHHTPKVAHHPGHSAAAKHQPTEHANPQIANNPVGTSASDTYASNSVVTVVNQVPEDVLALELSLEHQN
jgi:hypothetical protein